MPVGEWDGSPHFEQQDDDQERTRCLRAKGYRALRFWNNDALTNIESVLEAAMEALASPRPSPQPSPHPARDGERMRRPKRRSTGVNQ
jgi:very-short-patch-repair endonuclease